LTDVDARRTLALVVVAGVAALAGCGAEEESAETAAPASGAARTIEIRETEFALDPSTVSLDRAGTYAFRAVNDGSVDHALELEGNGIEEETETIGAGESAELTVELSEGTYELYCPVGNHRGQGMAGRVVVGAGAATTTTGGDATTDGETETSEDDDSDSGSGEGYYR
jgi:plastocyanin